VDRPILLVFDNNTRLLFSTFYHRMWTASLAYLNVQLVYDGSSSIFLQFHNTQRWRLLYTSYIFWVIANDVPIPMFDPTVFSEPESVRSRTMKSILSFLVHYQSWPFNFKSRINHCRGWWLLEFSLIILLYISHFALIMFENIILF
jgi:hypothetical protein